MGSSVHKIRHLISSNSNNNSSHFSEYNWFIDEESIAFISKIILGVLAVHLLLELHNAPQSATNCLSFTESAGSYGLPDRADCIEAWTDCQGLY